MKLTQHTWFLPVVGVAALAAQAWFESLVAMLAIGLPFFAMVLGGAWLRRTSFLTDALPRHPQASALSGFGQGIRVAVLVALVVLLLFGFAYIVWGRIHDNGIVGWLDAVQARSGGKYSEKVSAAVAMMYLLLAFAAGIGLLLRFTRSDERTPTAPDVIAAPQGRASVQSQESPASQRRMLLIVMLSLIAATWIVGFGVHTHVAMRHQEELHASYEPVDLQAPIGAARSNPFVVMDGRLHSNRYLSLKQRSTISKIFLPMVAPSESTVSPVHWVLQVDGSVMPPLSPAVYAHATGERLSQSTREAFERIGVPIAPDAVLADFVPTVDGRVVDRSADDRTFFIGMASVITASLALLLATTWIVIRLRERRSHTSQLHP